MVSFRDRRRRGFTLIELLIVVSIMTVLGGGLEALLRSQRGHVEHTNLLDRWSHRNSAALTTLARDVRQSPTAPVWADGALMVTTSSGDTVRYEVATVSDVVCLVRRQHDGAQTVLVTDVRQFLVERDGRALQVTIECEAVNESYRTHASHRTTIALWNRAQGGADQ